MNAKHQELVAVIANLTMENAKVNQENAKLKAELAALKSTPAQQEQQQHRQQPRQQPNAAPTTQPVAQTTKTPTTWAQRAATGPNIQNARKTAAAIRGFQPNTGPQGYDFVYICRSRKMVRSEVRSRLRRLGVDTARILDITFPARDVLGLLVHVQYKPLLKDTLVKQKIQPLEKFDPLDPKHIADPKHASLAAADRTRLAFDLHRNRLLSGLKMMREHVRPSVARSYVEIGWIADTDVPTPSAKKNRNDDDGFPREDHPDDMMAEDAVDEECY
jgi:hypothetical protein